MSGDGTPNRQAEVHVHTYIVHIHMQHIKARGGRKVKVATPPLKIVHYKQRSCIQNVT